MQTTKAIAWSTVGTSLAALRTTPGHTMALTKYLKHPKYLKYLSTSSASSTSADQPRAHHRSPQVPQQTIADPLDQNFNFNFPTDPRASVIEARKGEVAVTGFSQRLT